MPTSGREPTGGREEAQARHPRWPRASRLQEALRQGDPGQMVMWVSLDSYNVLEVLGEVGVDAVIIDREHGTFSMETVERMATAAEAAGMTTLVRPTRVDAREVSRLLDLGADGIVFPMVSNAEQAAAARRAMRYPPGGDRGWGGSHVRRLRWSAPPGLRTRAYLEAANSSLLSIFLIETSEGVERIGEILEHGQPDAIIFGWGDLGVSVGFDPAAALEAALTVYRACRARGVGVAIDPLQAHIPDFYAGCFYVAGVDATIVAANLDRHMQELRRTAAAAVTERASD